MSTRQAFNPSTLEVNDLWDWGQPDLHSVFQVIVRSKKDPCSSYQNFLPILTEKLPGSVFVLRHLNPVQPLSMRFYKSLLWLQAHFIPRISETLPAPSKRKPDFLKPFLIKILAKNGNQICKIYIKYINSICKLYKKNQDFISMNTIFTKNHT